MADSLVPFNLDLLFLDGPESVRGLRPVLVTDTMAGATKTFHPDGLYSEKIFGIMGDANRTVTFGYIDLRIPIFHPVVFKLIRKLKALHAEIVAGLTFARFDPQAKDFVKATPMDGNTGFAFFLSHWKSLEWGTTLSKKRDVGIQVIEKYLKSPLMDKLLVLPAGLRDYYLDAEGRPSEDEINDLYRKVLNSANVLQNLQVENNEELLNASRWAVQKNVEAVYDYFTSILSGKGNFIQGNWVSRRVDNGTWNIFTPYVQEGVHPKHPQFASSRGTVLGLYAYLRETFPISAYLVREWLSDRVFSGPNSPARVIDMKTLKAKDVVLSPTTVDLWMTDEGLESLFHQFRVKSLRHRPIVVDGHYLGLLHRDSQKGLRWVRGIDTLEKEEDAKDVRPITYVELFYLCVYLHSKKAVGTTARYPTTGYGSIYPGFVYLKTTERGDLRYWREPDREEFALPEFPLHNEGFFDAISPARQHLGRLGGDYDGDMGPHITALTHEAVEEMTQLLYSKDYYIATDGSMAFSASNDVLNLVLHSLTGDAP